jgi:DNA-binding beta-propeller fold protein YncE
VADTYNDKVKVINPKTKEVTSLVGERKNNEILDEPAGITYADGKLYLADTNASRIRVIDIATKKVSTLEIKGLTAPPPQKDWLPPK